MEDGVLRFQAGANSYVYGQGKFERPQAEEIKLPRVFYGPDAKVVWITTNDGYYAVDGQQSKFYQKDQLPFDPRNATAAESVDLDGDLWFLVPFSIRDYRLCVFRHGHLKPSSV